ncbi:MAG: hypothetical protein ABJE47_25850 [bacterium]
MENRQQRILQSHRRVQDWCAANPGLVPPPSGTSDTWAPITRQFDALNTLVATATQAAAIQATSGAERTLAATDEQDLRADLRRQMNAVTQVARAIRGKVPGISLLRLPPTKLQAESLLKAADSFVMQASKYETVLTDHALPLDFVAQIQRATSALKDSIDGRGAARASQVSATKQLAVTLDLGAQRVKILDAALKQVLRSDPAKLAEWRSVIRVTVKGFPSTDAGAVPPVAIPAPVGSHATTPPASVPVSSPAPAAKAA